MVPVEHLGRALAVLREKRHDTQEDVARVAGVTPSMISNYERGKEKPSIDSLWKILAAMNCIFFDLEAALRFVRGDHFPVQSDHWRVQIDDDFGPGISQPPTGGSGPFSGIDVRHLLGAEGKALPPEIAQGFSAMLQVFWWLAGQFDRRTN
jgi:transcriptional regulator with XRE-family HTH domain